ncbi:MAG: gamma-glutamyl-gamma-aminobutyrate hydrolase family protein [Candidatus Binatia bacterium]
MKPILILKTGELPRQVTENLGPYETAFLHVLGPERCVVVDARKEEMPGLDWAGVVVTGSPASTYDGDAWIAKSEAFLQRVADQHIPLYGVCFGHQLLAQTFGGRVEKCPHGWELGTVTITQTEHGKANSLFADVPKHFVAQMSHGDVVTELPPGAMALAQNDHWEYQAFLLGERIWGTQFHPEFTPQVLSDLIHALLTVLSPEAFPRRPETGSIREWLLATITEAPAARRCLENFARIAQAEG